MTMQHLKKEVIAIGGGLVVFLVLIVAIAGITGWLPYSDDKYYIALTGVATLVLAVGTLIFMWSQTSASKRVAGLQMFAQLDAQYDAERLRVARNELAPLLISGLVLPQPAEDILDFFEMMACYTREGHIDATLVSNGFSLPIRCYWDVLKGYVEEIRAAHEDKSLYEHVEWLNGRLVAEYAKDRGIKPAQAVITKEQSDRFFRSETTTIVPPRSAGV
jgi:hypothetical protein